MKVHPFIEAEKAAGHGVHRACRLLEVSRAAYYQRRHGVASPRAVADAVITAKITVLHAGSAGTYGSPRIHQALRKDEGMRCGKRRVARLMRTAGLEGRRKDVPGSPEDRPRLAQQTEQLEAELTPIPPRPRILMSW